MTEPAMLLTLQFLTWVSDSPRSYREVMDAWRTSCPRLSVWEDATINGLVRLGSGADGSTVVTLTPVGQALLDGVGVNA